MKANRVPVSVRLRDRIRKLESRLENGWLRRRGNPYCADCGLTNVQVSVREGRHGKGCAAQGLEKEIAHYRALLERAK